MAAWALVLLLAPQVQDSLHRALDQSKVDRRGLSVVVGRAGEAPLLVVAPDKPRAPASNQKILTAAGALWLLGRDFHFETRIAKGKGGELVVIGDGDPNLSGRFFDGDPTTVLRGMARDVVGKGIRRARLVLDPSRFDDEYVHPDWPADQLDRWYCAPVGGLVYNDSCWDISVYPRGVAGTSARVEISPALLKPGLLNRCQTTTGGNHVVHIGRAEGDDLEVRGRILLTSRGVTGHVTVRDPVVFFGQAFRAALVAEGVEIDGPTLRGQVPDAAAILAYRSDLERTLKVMLTNSQNLYAECLFKRCGKGSFASAGETLAAALRRNEVPTGGLVVRDGSGLSRENRCTARALYATLQALRDEPLFVDALAAGGEGTLRKRYRDLGPRIRAKTGTIRGVTTLSGYVTGRDSGRYVFSILANGRAVARARRLQDLVVQALAKSP